MFGHDGAGVSATDSSGRVGAPYAWRTRTARRPGARKRGAQRETAAGTPARVEETPCRRSPKRVGRRRWRRDGSQRACDVRATAATGTWPHGEVCDGHASTLPYRLHRKLLPVAIPPSELLGFTHPLTRGPTAARPPNGPQPAPSFVSRSNCPPFGHALAGEAAAGEYSYHSDGKGGDSVTCGRPHPPPTPHAPPTRSSNRPTPPDHVPEQST